MGAKHKSHSWGCLPIMPPSICTALSSRSCPANTPIMSGTSCSFMGIASQADSTIASRAQAPAPVVLSSLITAHPAPHAPAGVCRWHQGALRRAEAAGAAARSRHRSLRPLPPVSRGGARVRRQGQAEQAGREGCCPPNSSPRPGTSPSHTSGVCCPPCAPAAPGARLRGCCCPPYAPAPPGARPRGGCRPQVWPGTAFSCSWGAGTGAGAQAEAGAASGATQWHGRACWVAEDVPSFAALVDYAVCGLVDYAVCGI